MIRFGGVLLLTVVGCSSTTAPPPGPGTTTDAGSDTSVAIDAPPSDAGRSCKTNAECVAPGAKVCDVASGQCVACTKANDTCAPAEHCDAATKTCVAGCKSDEGCASSGDAGTSPKKCDTATNTCVQCLADPDCPAGFLCAGKVCSMGCSESKACPMGQTCCTGACVDTRDNSDHCGACGSKCMVSGASAKCEAGKCAIAMCDGLRGDCDRDITNACETDLSSTTANCGGCGTTCPFVVNGLPACSAGKCAAECDTAFGNCDGDLTNGCETNILNNRMNCGTCGNVCPSTITNGMPVCASGKCAAVCSSGYGDCDKNLSTGCETATATDPKNCGACGVECAALANATATCGVGACVIASCSAGYGNCDGVVTNGCEANFANDPSHCGGCGRPCNVANGVGSCASGVCGIASCTGGYKNCNGTVSDGCEINTDSDRNHCGACGNVCTTGESCVAGVCKFAPQVLYSQSFPAGTVSSTSSQCTAWNTFRGAIQASTTYSKVTLRGSRDTAGVSCSGSVANTLCQNLRAGIVMTTPTTCDGRGWMTGNCGLGMELSASGNICSCTSTYVARPCINNNNWGGINGATCGGTAQTIEVVCE